MKLIPMGPSLLNVFIPGASLNPEAFLGVLFSPALDEEPGLEPPPETEAEAEPEVCGRESSLLRSITRSWTMGVGSTGLLSAGC